LLRDYYKQARAEAKEGEARVRQCMTEVVDALEGFPMHEQDPNQQMEDMIEDLHWPTRLQGFDIKHEKA
jgi:polyhydroxyalkanoate synthesis regulator phasin